MESGKRILGLDFGRKRVGVAVSDPLLLMAHGRETLHYRQRRELLDRLRAIVEGEDVGLIVVGLPRHLSGDESDMTARVREFVAELQAQSSTPVITWDERLSSRQAERMLSARNERKRRDKDAIDRGAAVLILQSYLESPAFARTTA
ncbi:MAG: Holliday junction resolvase RuvX [bacterium]